MIIGTAGHIDHGKTALVRALTGIDADRLAEEKARGITIDLGYAWLPLGDTVAGFVDVPGHERFVHNMLAGATGVDQVLFVIAADDGVMPQTVEHLQIVTLLGIERGVIALTKADLADTALRTRRIAEIRQLLNSTPLASAPVIPTSTLTGEGIDALRAEIGRHTATARSATGYPRLAIDRCFTLQGTGLVVTGTMFAGEIRVGDRLMLSPKRLEVRVRGIHVHDKPAERAVAGMRTALNITGPRLSKDEVTRGDWVLAPEIHAPTMVLDVRLTLLASERQPLKHWTSVHVHLGAAHVTGRVALLEGDRLAPGSTAFAQIVLDEPIGALNADRVILRNQQAQATIGGAVVVDPFASARHRRREGRLARLVAMARPAEEAARQLLAIAPGYIERAPFSISYNLTTLESAALWDRLSAIPAAELVFTKPAWINARLALVETLATFHRDVPETPGLQPERLRAMLPLKLAKPAFTAILGAELKGGGVVVDGPWLRLPGHKVNLTAEDEARWQHIEAMIQMERFRPPRVRDFAHALDVPEADVRQLMRRVAHLGRVVEIAHDHYFLRATVAEMIRIAADAAEVSQNSEITAAAFRDRIHSGRKVAIQILEFFDRQGVTIRRGDRRRVRADRLKFFGDFMS